MSNTATNPITGDAIQTKVASEQYRSNYDAIFRKPAEVPIEVTPLVSN